jgi:Zn-dependent protease
MYSLNLVQRVAVYALPLLFALTVREMVRGRVAHYLGDPTGAQLGRLSLNPLQHVDPIGTLALPLAVLALSANGLGGFLIGWPRLIPIDWRRLRDPRRDIGLIAAAGLGANLAMAFLWGLILKAALAMQADEGLWLGVEITARVGVILNAGFFALNLLPLPPFDAGRVLLAVLPLRAAQKLASIEPYSFLILLLLMFTNLLAVVIVPLMSVVVALVFGVLSIGSGQIAT